MLAVRTPGAPPTAREDAVFDSAFPLCGTGSATPITIDFGAIFPFTSFRPTTSLSTLRSDRYRTPRKNSVRGCSLGFAAAVISDGRLQRAYKAQPAQIRAGPIQAHGSHLGCVTAHRDILTKFRMRVSACDTVPRYCARPVLC